MDLRRTRFVVSAATGALAYACALAISAILLVVTGTAETLTNLTGHPGNYFHTLSLVTHAAFGAPPVGHMDIPVGDIVVTSWIMPLVVTGIVGAGLAATHAYLERVRPNRAPGERWLHALATGFGVSLSATAVWLINNAFITVPSGFALTSELPPLIVGSLLAGVVFAGVGRLLGHSHRSPNSHVRGLACAVRVVAAHLAALGVLATVAGLLVSETLQLLPATAQVALFGNLAALSAVSAYGVPIDWEIDFAAVGEAALSGFEPLVAMDQLPWWRWMLIPAAILAIIAAAYMWAHLRGRYRLTGQTWWHLPAIYAATGLALIPLSAMTLTGWMRVSGEYLEVTAHASLSWWTPLILGAVGLVCQGVSVLARPAPSRASSFTSWGATQPHR